MKGFIGIALWGISSFVIFSYLWKLAAKKYKKLEILQKKFSDLKKRNLYSNIITFSLIILIVFIKERFNVGDAGYGLLLGAFLSISDFLFNKVVTEEEKYKNNNKNYPRSNKSVNNRKKK